jgi:beta-ureidopropionase / N-carbamoyl-L-amino-acid hydrolase
LRDSGDDDVGFDALWAELERIGRAPSGGYRRFAWTHEDLMLREWFAAAAAARGLDLVVDRAGNQWAWWGSPDDGAGVVAGSHLDSVPDGGAFDGPLGVVCAFCAIDALRDKGFRPSRPLGVVNFADEEGARFGLACAGSRLLTGTLTAARAMARRDIDGVTLAEALRAAGRPAASADPVAVHRVGVFVELHIEQGRGLVDLDAPIGIGTTIWPHGRWRVDLLGEANHAGTTRLADRRDPMLDYAQLVLAARDAARRHGALATCGKVRVEPNGVNAIPSRVTAWVDARAPQADAVRRVIAELPASTEESWTDETTFDGALRARLAAGLDHPPQLATGAGHDAGILAAAGIPSAMLFVRNPTGVSHSPAELAERADCLAGVEALTAVLEDLAT